MNITLIYILVIILILLSIILFIKYQYTHIRCVFYNKNDVIEFFTNNNSAIQYINSIDPNTIIYKTDDNPNISRYFQLFENFTDLEKKSLQKQIKELSKGRPLLKTPWKFFKTNNQLEQGMPFTLGDVIFLPENFVKNLTSDPNSNTSLAVLCHEKIHVLQRKFTQKFNNFIKKNFGFKLIKINEKYPITIFSNPDGLQIPEKNWIYKYNNSWYLPYLEWNNGLQKLAIKLSKYRDNWKFTNEKETVYTILYHKIPECPSHQLYHPYEIMAEFGSMYLMEGSCKNSSVDKFYQKFSADI